jgi:hypothetical protein
VETLQMKYPDLTHADALRHIDTLRGENNVSSGFTNLIWPTFENSFDQYALPQGKLSGLSFVNIQERLGALVRQERAAKAGGLQSEGPQEVGCRTTFSSSQFLLV